MAFGSRLLVNFAILTLICAIMFAFISCVEAALTDSGEGRSLQFFLYLLYSYLGVVGVHGGPPSDAAHGVDTSNPDRYARHC